MTITGKGDYTGTVVKTYTIAPAKLTVVTDDASKVYDGKPLAGTGTVTGFVEGETYSFAATGTQTAVGTSDNGYSLVFDGTAKQGNYTIDSETIGKLTVTPQSITPGDDPDNPDPAYAGITVDSPVDVVYNGNVQEWAPKVVDSEGHELVAGRDYTVEYSGDTTNVTDGGITVTITGTGNYSGTVVRTYKITPAQLTVTTASASKVFDGTALTKADEWTLEGIVDGETATVVPDGTITKVGSTDNTYTIAWGTAASTNYTVDSETLGKLTVTPQSITPGDDPDNPDPSYKGVEVDDPSNATYDGDEHKWTPVVTDKDGNPLEEGKDYEVTYDKDDFTDAGTITVTITGKGDYTGTIVKTYTIDPAKYTVTTESASKVYDGTELTAGGRVEGIVEGETYSFAATGTITFPGSVTNGYTMVFDGTAKAGNYELAGETLGTLTVTDSTDQIVVTTTGGTFVYDGEAHGATVAVSTLPTGYTLKTAASTATATNVAEGVVAATADQLVIVNANGDDVTASLNVKFVDGAIQITPATLNVTTGSASKTYDGTALTEGTLEIRGLVGTDSVSATTTGTQTAVGSSQNTYRITWGSVDPANYTIVENLGTLTVNAVVPTPTPTPTPPSPTVVDNVASTLEGAYDAVAGPQNGEQIFDAENPLGQANEPHCWVHFYIIIGIVLTVLYGAVVVVRRTRDTNSRKNDMNDILGGDGGKDPDPTPAVSNQPSTIGA